MEKKSNIYHIADKKCNKVLRTMKISVLFLFLGTLSLYAGKIYSQQTDISVHLNNVTIRDAFSQIEKSSDYIFLMSDNIETALNKRVELSVDDKSINEVLNLLLQNTNLGYRVLGKQVLIYADNKQLEKDNKQSSEEQMNTVEQQPKVITVKGVVTDDKKEPLPGVTIIVKGTNKGTVTDVDGAFSINLNENEKTLIFSFVGMEPQTVILKNQTTLNIIMKSSQDLLDEVVVTGYQTISKERSAGSFSKVNMDFVQNRTSGTNVISRLDGLVPGLAFNFAPSSLVVAASGLLNEGIQTDNQILLRGLTSMYSNRAPLFVVDGVPYEGNIDNLNPWDVSDVTILRDATSSSIWGSQASNGVIVITTKKGAHNKKVSVNYDGYINMQGRPNMRYNKMLSSRQFIETAKEVFDPVKFPYEQLSSANTAPLFSYGGIVPAIRPHEQILYDRHRGLISEAQAEMKLDSLASIDNLSQYEDLFLQSGSVTNHTVTVSGGGGVHAFYGSVGYTGNTGTDKGSESERYKLNLRQDFTFNKYINMYLISDFTLNESKSKRPYTTLRKDLRYSTLPPYQLFVDEAGNSLDMSYLVGVSDSLQRHFGKTSGVDLSFRPADELNNGWTTGKTMETRLTAGITVKLFKALRFENLMNFTRGAIKSTNFDSEKSYKVREEMASFTTFDPVTGKPIYYLSKNFLPGALYSVSNTQQTAWTVRNQLSYEGDWGKHQVSILAGQEVRKNYSITNSSLSRGYNEMLQQAPALDYVALMAHRPQGGTFRTRANDSGLQGLPFTEYSHENRYLSYYSNIGYTFDRKYSLNASWRFDQTNLFAKDKATQDRPFYSVGLKWNMSEEDFLKSLKSIGIDRLSIRGTYGVTGNAPTPGTAATVDIYSTSLNSDYLKGIRYNLSTIANNALTWESTDNLNIGLDLTAFNNRLDISLDIYRKKTTNAINEMYGNVIAGASSYIGNSGDILNQGIELKLNGVVIQNANFLWSTNVNVAYNKGKIMKVDQEFTYRDLMYQSIIFAKGYAPGAIFAYYNGGLNEKGRPIEKLPEGISEDEQSLSRLHYMGSMLSPWLCGWNNYFTYKNFNLSSTIVFNLGGVMRRNVNMLYTGRLLQRPSAEFADRWKKPGDEAFTIIPGFTNDPNILTGTGAYVYSDANVVSSSFIKMRDITLSYQLPRKWAERVMTENIAFRIQMSNIMLWKANKYGLDPEFQDAFYGNVWDSVEKNPYMVNTNYSYPVGQNAITLGLHIGF